MEHERIKLSAIRPYLAQNLECLDRSVELTVALMDVHDTDCSCTHLSASNIVIQEGCSTS